MFSWLKTRVLQMYLYFFQPMHVGAQSQYLVVDPQQLQQYQQQPLNYQVVPPAGELVCPR